MLREASLPDGPQTNGQYAHHLQAEADKAVSTRDVGSEKKTRLLMMGLGFGCFALGVASTCLALPRASHAGSHLIQADVDAAFAFNPNMATAPKKAAPKFLPKVSRTSGTPAMGNRELWPGESTDPLTLSRVFVLLFNPQTRKEGIYTFQRRQHDEDGTVHDINKVALFEKQEDAERYAGLLKADGLPTAQVKSLDPREVGVLAPLAGPTASFIPAGTVFLPPPQIEEAGFAVVPEELASQPDSSKPWWTSEDHGRMGYLKERARSEASQRAGSEASKPWGVSAWTSEDQTVGQTDTQDHDWRARLEDSRRAPFSGEDLRLASLANGQTDTDDHDSIDYTEERARLEALVGSAHDSWPGESNDPLALSRVFVLLFNPQTDKEGIYTLEKQVRDEVGKVHHIIKVVLFEKQEDAERFAARLEVDGLSAPQVKSLDPHEVKALAQQYKTSLVPAGSRFVPPQHNSVPEALRQDAEDHDGVDYTKERARLEALFDSA